MAKDRKFYGWKLVAALWFLYLLNLGFPLYGGRLFDLYKSYTPAYNLIIAICAAAIIALPFAKMPDVRPSKSNF
jgi:hypothetical protein